VTGTDTTDSAAALPEPASAPETAAGSDPSPAPAPSQAEYPPDPKAGASVLWIALVAILVGAILVIVLVGGVRHWAALHTGVLNGGPDHYYNFWSGIGSDLGEATLISAVGIGVYTGLRKVNCHTKGCWRIGKHPLSGTPYILCRHHHPHVPSKGATHEQILEQHRRWVETQGR
jgi:hypothetical protein